MEIRDLDDDGVEWMKCYLEKLDMLLSKVVNKEISPHDFVTFIWIASFAWKKKRSERNYMLKSPEQIADNFGVSKETVGKRLKRLRDAKLLQTIYRVKHKGEIKHFKDEKKSWKYRDKSGGQIITSIQKIIDDTFIVELNKDGQTLLPKKD